MNNGEGYIKELHLYFVTLVSLLWDLMNSVFYRRE